MTATRHPSYLELDRLAVGGIASTALRSHVEGCAVCRAHLERVAPAQAVPSWVAERSEHSAAPHPRRLRAALFGVVLASAAGMLLWRAPTEPAHYDTKKGLPSVLVHVQHRGVHRTWDGAPLEAGDQIRLEVAPEDFRYVSVFGAAAAGQPAPALYRGPVPPHVHTPLDKAWQLDAQPGAERLTLVFSHAPVSLEEARQMLAAPSSAVHVVELVLPKRATP
jgi:hypothetical protein